VSAKRAARTLFRLQRFSRSAPHRVRMPLSGRVMPQALDLLLLLLYADI
jgi:hypothetical protein